MLWSLWGCWKKKLRKTSGLEWLWAVVGWQRDARCLTVIQDRATTEVGTSELLLQQDL